MQDTLLYLIYAVVFLFVFLVFSDFTIGITQLITIESDSRGRTVERFIQNPLESPTSLVQPEITPPLPKDPYEPIEDPWNTLIDDIQMTPTQKHIQSPVDLALPPAKDTDKKQKKPGKKSSKQCLAKPSQEVGVSTTATAPKKRGRPPKKVA
ncbi:MAG: hypothetical protein KME30_31670 [Iphinoe sp. HA4291-MV1]|jgi:hypothetical protein|nr:hypothetical protein [Iphinoe sp. HA4291-MV1]